MKFGLFVVFLAVSVAVTASQLVPENLQKEVENLNDLMEDNKLKAEDDPLLQKKISDLNEAMMDMQKKIEAAKAEKARKLAAKKKEVEDEQEALVKAQQQQQAELDKQKKREEAARKAAAKKKEEEDDQKAKVKAQQRQQAEFDKQKKIEEAAAAAAKEQARQAALKKKVEETAHVSVKVQKEEPTESIKSNKEQEQYRRDVELLVKLMVPVTAWDIWVYTNVFPYLPMMFRSPSSSGINSFVMLILLCICLWFVRESRHHSLSLENEIKAMEFQKQVTQSTKEADKSLQDQLKASKTLIQNMKQERLASDVKILALTSEKDSLKGLYAHLSA